MSESQSTEIVKYNPLLNYPELTTKDIEVASMSDLNRQVIMASQNFPRIRTLDQMEVRNTLIETIALIIWESGFGLPEQEQELLINYMIEEIKRDFFHLTLEEVKIALKKGLRGHYGEVFGMNVRMLYGWLDAYVAETKLAAMKQLQLIKKLEPPKEVSEETKKFWHNKWLESSIDAFEEYKKNGYTSFYDIQNSLYNYIRYKMRLVDLTKEETDAIWNEAVAQHKKEHSRANARSIGEAANFKAVLEKMESGDVSEQEKIKVRARKIALLKLFEKMKIANINFQERIKKYEENLLNKENKEGA